MAPAPDLLHTALNRHASQQRTSDGEPLSPQALERLRLSSDDDEQIEVRTPLGSVAGSVASSPSSSRSASPTRAAAGKRKGGAGKPRRDKTKEREKSEAMKNPLDPFLRFPGQVLGRVLGYLGYQDLTRVGLVSKRWRRSQTLSASSPLVSGAARLTMPAFSSLCPASRRLHVVPPPPVLHLHRPERPHPNLRRVDRAPDLAQQRGVAGLGRPVREHLHAARRARGGRVGPRRERVDAQGGARAQVEGRERGGRACGHGQERHARVLQGARASLSSRRCSVAEPEPA